MTEKEAKETKASAKTIVLKEQKIKIEKEGAVQTIFVGPEK